MEPELEIHAVKPQDYDSDNEIQCIVTHTSCDKTTVIQKEECEQLDMLNTTKYESWDLGVYHGFEFTSSFSWSDDDCSAIAGIQESIIALREEEAQIDAIVVIDKLDTLKQEFNTVKRQLHIRSAEVQQLKALVARSSNTLGQVELEHDFYRADAEQLR